MLTEEYIKLKENATHGDFMVPLIVYDAHIPYNYTFYPIHWHDEVELIYVHYGTFDINLNLKTYTLKKGDLVFLSPGTLHGFRQHKNDTMCITTILFNINILGVQIPDACSLKYFTPLLEGKYTYNPIITSDNQNYQKLVDCFTKLKDNYRQTPPLYELELKYELFKMFKYLFSSVFKEVYSTPEIKEENVKNIKTILDYIKDNYSKEITIDELAQLLNFSKSHFMRFFKKNLGLTAIDYINEYRLNVSSNLLVNTNLTITEIATKIGISNVSYFNRLFKKHFQVSPMQYRKNFYQKTK